MALKKFKFENYLTKKVETSVFGSKRERTRANLRLAAAVALNKSGYNNLRIEDICEQAGIALGTFYLYYENKKLITLDVLSEFTENMWHLESKPPAPESVAPYDKLFAANLYYVQVFRANTGMMKCLMQADDHNPEFTKIWQNSNRRWLERFAEDIEKNPNTWLDNNKIRKFTAHALGGMADSVLYAVFIRKDKDLTSLRCSNEAIARYLTDIWFRAVYGQLD